MPAVSGSPTQLKTSVLTLADLEGQPDDAYLDGDMAYVASTRATYQLDRASTAASNGSTVLDTYSSNGRWNLFATSITWESQATWYIDSVTGSDENDGDTALTALATWEEFTRRVQTLNVTMTVNIVSAPLQRIIGSFKTQGAYGLTVLGVVTVLVTSTGATTFVNPTGGARGTVTAAGIDFSLYVRGFARVIEAGIDNIMPITSNAGAVGRGGSWAKGPSTVKPVDNSVVEVIQLPSVEVVRIYTDSVPVQVKYLEVTSATEYSVVDARTASNFANFITWEGCHFKIGIRPANPVTLYAGCLFDRAAGITFVAPGKSAQFYGGGSIGGIVNGGHASSAFYFQGFLVEGGASGTVFSGGSFSDSASYPLGVFASTAAAITMQNGAVFASGGATYGSTSGATGISIATAARFSCPSGTPSITGSTNDFTVDTLTALVAPPTAGGVWAAAVDLSGAGGVGWGKWVAGGRKFVNYATLSAVTS